MKVIDCVQKSDEWWKVRRGIPTASEFDKIITPKTMKASSSQDGYICKLIGERFASIWPNENGYVSRDMSNGIETEPMARAWYAFEMDIDVQEVGFCFSDCEQFGCSPDGLVGDDGGLEIKCPNAETQARYLLEGELPSEYRCQVHGELLVTGRAWWDFISYCEGMPTFVCRVTPNDFTEALKNEVARFCAKYRDAVAKIESMRK